MNRREKLNWLIALVGLIASVISIIAFLTGANSLPSIMKKPERTPPAITNPTMLQGPPVVTEKKKPSPGDAVTAPLKNGINWAAGRLKIRKPSPKANDASTPQH